MFFLRSSARARIVLAGAGVVTLLAWPESPATILGAAQRQAVGRAVPRDPQPPSQRRRTPARAQALREASEQGLDHIPGEVIVKFKNLMPSSRRQRALNALRSRPSVNDLEWYGDVAVLTQPIDSDARAIARTLSAQPEVEYAEPNYLIRIKPVAERVQLDAGEPRPALTPNDPAYGMFQWNLTGLDMPRAWDINPGGSSDIIVAIIDTGVTTVNQTFTFPTWTGSSIQSVPMPFAISPGMQASRLTRARNVVSPEQPVLDLDGHGTHIASTVAETTNDMASAAGIAYNATIMPVKVCNSWWDQQIDRSSDGIAGRPPANADTVCSTMDVALGIEYAAEQGAKVINISLGGPGNVNRLREAVGNAVQRGAFVAIAMGNDFEEGNEISYPAKYAELFQGAMSVAAVGRSLTSRASYSSTGSHCEIAAPGGDPSLDINTFVVQTSLREPSHTSDELPVFNSYTLVGSVGTSMASPHVAGLAALLMSQRPGITPAQVESIIRATAKDLGPPGRDDEFGFGLIQPRAALFGLGIRR